MKKSLVVISVLFAGVMLLSACGGKADENASGHTHEYSEEWVTVVSPTCQREGLQTRTCKYCEKTLRNTLPRIDHNLGNWTADAQNHWRECSMCHQKFVDTQIPGTGPHAYDNGETLCKICGYDSAGTAGLVFEISSDKSYYVVKDMENTSAESIEVPETYCSLPVCSILDSAFQKCTAVKSISLPSGITYIGGRAFEQCSSLERIKVSEKNTHFRSADGILYTGDMSTYVHVPARVSGKINVPVSITTLGTSVFAGRAITEIELPTGLVSIGELAFSGCTELTELIIPTTVKEIGRNAFAGCTSLERLSLPIMFSSKVTLPKESAGALQGNTFIGYIFGAPNVYGLDSALPESLKEIEFTGGEQLDRYTFRGCSNIERVTLPETLRVIDSSAFAGCNSLREVIMSEGVKTIGANVFAGCTSLTALSLPATVTSFDISAVQNCSALTRIDVAPGNGQYASQSGVLYNKAGTNMLYVPAQLGGDVTIPEGITSLNASAFKGRQITSVEIPAGVTVIGEQCFANCSRLGTVTIAAESKLRSFSDYCFSGCTQLTSIVIPAEVTYIGSFAFISSGLQRASFAVKKGWNYSMPNTGGTETPIGSDWLSDEVTAAQKLTDPAIGSRTWTRK